MEYKIIIPGKLSGLNEYINAERTSRYKAAEMKSINERIISVAIMQSIRGIKITKKVFMEYTWIEPNKWRDYDNISSFGRKCIQDALVKEGVLKDDGWKHIVGFSDRFEVDRENPRIEVKIREV